MFATTDTIVAVATPPGRGAIGVVRLSGPAALPIAGQLAPGPIRLVPRHATLVTLTTRARPSDSRGDADTALADRVIVTYFPGPHSYTGEDVVEVSAHGSGVVLAAIVGAALASGARLAEPGEFTLRAFLNGRIDLTQAEAVADLVDAVTPLQARAAFDQLDGTLTRRIGEIDAALFDLAARLEASVDFPDEGYHFVDPERVIGEIDAVLSMTEDLRRDARRGRMLREGLQVAIVGAPNVGKSSLFNALVGSARAIVTEVPGTTRDLVTESVDIEGFRVTLVDTAGLRETSDIVEGEGVRLSRQVQATADLLLCVYDQSRLLDENREALGDGRKGLMVASKADLPARWTRPDAVRVSVVTGEGLNEVRQRMLEALGLSGARERPALTNVRHAALVERAHEALRRARAALAATGGALSEEFVLADLEDARHAFEEVTGRRSSDDLLTHIFARFCLGK